MIIITISLMQRTTCLQIIITTKIHMMNSRLRLNLKIQFMIIKEAFPLEIRIMAFLVYRKMIINLIIIRTKHQLNK